MFSFNTVPVKESKQAEPAVFWPCFSNASLSISHPPIQIFPFFPFSRPQKGIAATRPPRSTLFNHRPPQVTVRVSCQMQSLQQKAAQWSGVDTADAFAIDETNLFQKLGLQTFINLSTDFYTRVYDDEEDWFRSIFANSKKEEAIQNQYEFFVQRMGGPPLYSQRKGHPALIGRHRPFPVTHQAAERWLYHMQNALANAADIDPDSKTKMMNFFRHTAFFLVAGDELKQQRQEVPCKHSSGKPASG